MTAVASPPSVQSGPRLGWYSSGNEGQGAVSSMNADDVSRILMQRKTLQRSSSSSSLGSTSSTSTVSPTPPSSHAGQSSNPDSGTWSSSKKKTSRNPWPSSKAEPVSGLTNARPQPVSTFSPGPTASSTMSAAQQPSHVVPSQHMHHPQQQNGVRGGSGPSADPPALLTLIPTNGTFERKHINVPYYPEVLRVGRQTNAKTIPTPVNGYFDSKVLSRQHAEIWADKSGKIWIRDVKSSNGTFVNGQRLSPENRESEAHELRENDTLELGIDIVSEDQKTIVHHKVSAKVDHSGVYGNSVPNILDLNFGDLDPASGNGLLPSPLSQPVSHLRGRAGSNMSNRSASSGQFSAMHQQRQMNYWNSPISVEQVVKRLSSEMRQAKQQSQDLRQTDDFLTTIMKPGYMEKERAKHSQPEINPSRQVNGRPKMPRVDSFSRFSDPPAPPPQQPLPEKPDALPRNGVDLMSPLKRSETEKPKPPSNHSPASRESSQILSLVDALSSAKRELDSQGARVKELETLLLQERTARESAEARARDLETRPGEPSRESEVTAAFEPPSEANHEDTAVPREQARSMDLDVSAPARMTDVTSKEPAPTVDGYATQLQHRLETLVGEMEEMRQQVAVFKDRAYKAEDESVKARKSLAEMIETLRRERSKNGEAVGNQSAHGAEDHAGGWGAAPSCLEEHSRAKDSVGHVMMNPRTKEAEDATTTFAAGQGKQSFAEQSSPYASMLGVVLLGVGLMAYLNGWQKMER